MIVVYQFDMYVYLHSSASRPSLRLVAVVIAGFARQQQAPRISYVVSRSSEDRREEPCCFYLSSSMLMKMALRSALNTVAKRVALATATQVR